MKKRRMNNGVLEICDEDDQVILSIAESLRDGTMCMELSGQIRNEVAYEFEDEVMAALTVCPSILIKLENVSYIASMALRSLLSVQQVIDDMEGASMTLVDVSPEVMEILKESGFSEILTVENG